MKIQNFVVECIKDEEINIFVIRDLQGRVIKVCNTPDDLTTFFSNLELKS